MTPAPGSSWRHPIRYRVKWRIFVSDGPYRGYDYVHDDYDGAPDSHDRRHGFAATAEECQADIDALEDDEP